MPKLLINQDDPFHAGYTPKIPGSYAKHLANIAHYSAELRRMI